MRTTSASATWPALGGATVMRCSPSTLDRNRSSARSVTSYWLLPTLNVVTLSPADQDVERLADVLHAHAEILGALAIDLDAQLRLADDERGVHVHRVREGRAVSASSASELLPSCARSGPAIEYCTPPPPPPPGPPPGCTLVRRLSGIAPQQLRGPATIRSCCDAARRSRATSLTSTDPLLMPPGAPPPPIAAAMPPPRCRRRWSACR